MKEKKMGAGSEGRGSASCEPCGRRDGGWDWGGAAGAGGGGGVGGGAGGGGGGDADTLVTAGLFARNAQLPPWPARQNLKIRHN
jgi:hypothetical protein